MALVGRIWAGVAHGRLGCLLVMARRICRATLVKGGSGEVSTAITKLRMRRRNATRLP